MDLEENKKINSQKAKNIILIALDVLLVSVFLLMFSVLFGLITDFIPIFPLVIPIVFLVNYYLDRRYYYCAKEIKLSFYSRSALKIFIVGLVLFVRAFTSARNPFFDLDKVSLSVPLVLMVIVIVISFLVHFYQSHVNACRKSFKLVFSEALISAIVVVIFFFISSASAHPEALASLSGIFSRSSNQQDAQNIQNTQVQEMVKKDEKQDQDQITNSSLSDTQSAKIVDAENNFSDKLDSLKGELVQIISGNKTDLLNAINQRLFLSGGTINGDLKISGTLEADQYKGINLDDYLKFTGGEMKGSLILKRDPVSDLEAATKHYVDSHMVSAGVVSWGSIQGSISNQADLNTILAGKLSSETDPLFSASIAHGITDSNITNWNTAYGWGNHALAGYLTGTKVDSFNGRIGPVNLTRNDVTNALGFMPYDSSNPSGYITSSEAPVQSVAGRTGAIVLSQLDISGLTASDSPNFQGLTVNDNNGNRVINLDGNNGIVFAGGSAYGNSSSPTYSFMQDDDTGMYLQDEDVLSFVTGGNNVLTLNNSNVGIGTTNPTRPLSVNGSFSVNDGGGFEKAVINDDGMIQVDGYYVGRPDYPAYGFINDSDTGMYLKGEDVLSFSTGGSDALTINNGRVGIGTNDPQAMLDVNNSNYGGGDLLSLSNSNGQAFDIDGNGLVKAGGQYYGYPSSPTYSFVNDTDSGMYLQSDDILSLATGGQPVLTIKYDSVSLGGNNDVESDYSFATGDNNYAYGYASVAMGTDNETDDSESIAIGRSNTASGYASFAMGSNNESNGHTSFALGKNTYTDADYAMVIGQGVDGGDALYNGIQSSLAVGFNSDIPTFFVGPSDGQGTIGRVGIGTVNPNSELDINQTNGSNIFQGDNDGDRVFVIRNDGELQINPDGNGNSGPLWVTDNGYSSDSGAVAYFESSNRNNSALGLYSTDGGNLIDARNNENDTAFSVDSQGGVSIIPEGNNYHDPLYIRAGSYGTDDGALVELNEYGGNNSDIRIDKVNSSSDFLDFYNDSGDGLVFNVDSNGNIYSNGDQLIPDYVFDSSYKMLSLGDLQTYISTNKHLPGVPDMNDKLGWRKLSMQDRDMLLLQKIEETTLYTLQNSDQISQQQTQISAISDQVSTLSLKTDQSITTVSQLQSSVDDQFLKVQGVLSAQAIITDKNIQSIATLQDGLNSDDKKIKSIEDVNADLQSQIDDLQKMTNQDLNVAQIGLNTTDISFIKTLLGTDRVKNPGDVDLLGKFSAEGIETGNLVIKVVDKKKRTTGTDTITAVKTDSDNDGIDDKTGSNGKSFIVKTTAVDDNSKIYLTPVGSTDNQVLYVGKIKTGESFEVKVDKAVANDVSFNWWIVETLE